MDMATGSLEPALAPEQEAAEAGYKAEAASLVLATLVRLTAHAGAALTAVMSVLSPTPDTSRGSPPSSASQLTQVLLSWPTRHHLTRLMHLGTGPHICL